MSVINPDEWRPVAVVAAGTEWAVDYQQRDIRAAAAVLCLLDLARYGTVQWFPDTDPADVPWAPEPDPEWVRCVNEDGVRCLTDGKVYRVVGRWQWPGYAKVINDAGEHTAYWTNRFVPATADEATVTIDVPVEWAERQAWAGGMARPPMSRAVHDAVTDACREALTKAGLL